MFDKRGVSHIEEVISFVIFIGFLVFAYLFFSPFRGDRTLDSTLDYAYREIKSFSEMDVQSYSVFITDNSLSDTPIGIQIGTISYPNVSVEDSGGNIIDSYVQLNGNFVYFDMPPDKFARIKYGEDYWQNPNFISGANLIADQYTISSSEEKKIYSIKRAVNLSTEYKLYYSDLKKRFNLPNRVDFGFSFTLENGSVIKAEQVIPDNAEVKARNERVEFTLLAGEEQFADLIVKVW